jgi:hypothetical protein
LKKIKAEKKPEVLWKQRLQDNNVVMAYVSLWKAVLQFRQGWYVYGGVNLRNASLELGRLYGELDLGSESKGDSEIAVEVTHQNLVMGDILYAYGAFQFFASMIPPAFQSIADLLGFPANREAGFMNLLHAGKLLSSTTGFVRMHLMFIKGDFYQKEAEAEAMYKESISFFPNSPFLHYFAGYTARSRGRIEDALEV